MKALQVTSNWLKWFQSENIELVTTIDDREMFTKIIKGEIHGNQLSYKTVFKLVESFLSVFCFLKIEKIRLVWCEKLENDNLQFYNYENSFENWKCDVLKRDYEMENSFEADYEDSTEIYYNYSVNADGKDLSLYQFEQTDRTAIFLWYNPKTDTTIYTINTVLRKALFSIDKNFEVHLPDDFIEHNEIILAQIDDKIMNKIKAV
jgi:hypothetical protein